MVIVYVTRSGKVEEKELVKETPKGFRVIRRGHTSMELAVQWYSSTLRFEGKHEKFEIATLSKSEADAHALSQRKEIVERVLSYQDHWLKHVGINPNQYRDMLNLSLDMDKLTK